MAFDKFKNRVWREKNMPTVPEDQDKVVVQHLITMVNAAAEDGKLNSWEKSFVFNVNDQWETWGKVSPRQREILERIYKERC